MRPLSEDERARLRKAEIAAKPLPGSPPKGFQQRVLNLVTRFAMWVINSAVNRYLPLVTAPLLAIPVVGWVLYFSLNGFAAGMCRHPTAMITVHDNQPDFPSPHVFIDALVAHEPAIYDDERLRPG